MENKNVKSEIEISKKIFDQPSEDWGSNSRSREYFERYMKNIGNIETIHLIPRSPKNTSPIVQFMGSEGIISCYGFFWGYIGTSPSGLRWAICKILEIDYYGEKSLELRKYISGLNMDKEHIININQFK